jgi:hypothetical protein
MPRKKSHHFVPQFYLRNFGAGNSISVFNIASRKTIPSASIPSQCQRDYLYGKTPEVEDSLGALEGMVSGIIRAILSEQLLPLKDSEDHALLILFLSLQMSRSPKTGRSLLVMQTRLTQAIARDLPGMPPGGKGFGSSP